MADLKGKTFCFVDPNSTSGYIIPRIILKANGIDPDKDFKATQNAGSHDNVGIAVYKGDCDAGVTYIDVLTDAAANLKAKYPDITRQSGLAFADTDRIPNDGVQYVKDLDPKIQAAITDGLLAMAADPGGNAGVCACCTPSMVSRRSMPPSTDDFADVLEEGRCGSGLSREVIFSNRRPGRSSQFWTARLPGFLASLAFQYKARFAMLRQSKHPGQSLPQRHAGAQGRQLSRWPTANFWRSSA